MEDPPLAGLVGGGGGVLGSGVHSAAKQFREFRTGLGRISGFAGLNWPDIRQDIAG